MNRFANRFTDQAALDLLSVLRQARTLGAADLLARLRQFRPTTSRATMMRMVKALGDQVVVRGAARSTAYAARRPIRGRTEPIPVYRLDPAGRGDQIGQLDPLYPEGCALRYDVPLEWPLADEMRDGWFPGLPYPFEDMRPQGFLGRNLAHSLSGPLQVPEDPRRWHEDDVLYVLSKTGSDCSGNYILGDGAYRRHLETVQQGYHLVGDDALAQAYPEQADHAMAAGVAGSSAGGEFPKFTLCREGAGRRFHVLVKFSGNDGSAAAQRLSDLLVCEHLALQAIAGHLQLPAARSSVYRYAGRTFLEVERFDRHGEFGRSPVCTWSALEGALFGMAGESWLTYARAGVRHVAYAVRAVARR
ncbi:DNA-binding protein [Pseudoduganella sp. LjRoot289]|uniref:type II toxin-antitoxin system HipA family toxin YjjJ n=1 Tax=Pseudoduganella sp. LjRoot289 TaxID=3342314 RepID=UPI003ED00ED8